MALLSPILNSGEKQMNYRKSIITITAACLMLAGSVAAFGQTETRLQVEPSYDVTLQLIIGSNDAGQRTELPANLASVSRQLKASMPFAGYRVAGTFLGRVSNSGNFEYKSMSNIFGEATDLRSQSFQEWSLVNLKGLPMAKGGQGFQAQVFRFGARVPVATGGSFKDDTGKSMPIVNYESIGLNLAKVGAAENTPTLIGTLSLPGANGTIFLVMTVKAVEM
jgi:hypothetical protein